MEPQTFDRLARRMATCSTRRRLLGGLVAGALGLAGRERTEAAACRGFGSVCREGANCCSKRCNAKDADGRRRCGCRTVADCPAAPACQAVTCLEGVCVTTITPGAACDDGDPCTTNSTCTAAGRCAGTPVVCKAKDDCHEATCDRDGQCRQTPLTGTPCNDGNVCTNNDTCQSGTCTGTAIECPTGQVCDPLLGCVCSTSDGCPAGRECFNGGCFLPNPGATSKFCTDVCGPSDIAPLGGQLVCVSAADGICTSHADCPVGQACMDCPSPPCLLSCLSPC